VLGGLGGRALFSISERLPSLTVPRRNSEGVYYGGWGKPMCRPQGEILQQVKGSKHCIWPSRCHCHLLSLAPVNPNFTFLVLLLWYWLTRVVPDKIQNSQKTIVCVCVCVCACVFGGGKVQICHSKTVHFQPLLKRLQNNKIEYAMETTSEKQQSACSW